MIFQPPGILGLTLLLRHHADRMERRRLAAFLPRQEDCAAFQNFVIEAIPRLEIMLLAKLLGKRNRVILRDEDRTIFQMGSLLPY